MKSFSDQIARAFTSYQPNEVERVNMAQARAHCAELAHWIDITCPDGREKSLALTNLEQVMFWANASIARPPEVRSK